MENGQSASAFVLKVETGVAVACMCQKRCNPDYSEKLGVGVLALPASSNCYLC